MSIKLLRQYIREASEIIRFSPDELARSAAAPGEFDLPQKITTKIKQKDKTHYTVSQVLFDIAKNAGPNTQIRYEDSYNDLVPQLNVSDIISYSPHGLYSYPLSQKNAMNLASTGIPTDVDYAVDFDYFHIYKIVTPDSRMLTYHDTVDDIKIDSPIKNRNDVIVALKEALRGACELIVEEPESVNEEISEQFLSSINKNSNKILNEFLEECFKFSKYDVNGRKLITQHNEKIANIIFNNSWKKISSTSKNKVQIELYNIVKETVTILASIVTSKNIDKPYASNGRYLSILLHMIGLDALIDKGTGKLIHPAEKSQAVSHDFTGRGIEVIGTYKNIFQEELNGDEDFSRFEEEFINIILDNNIPWEWD